MGRKLAAVPSAKLGKVRRMFFKSRRGRTVALGVRAMTNGAIGAEHLLPCFLRGHPWGWLRLFLRECDRAASQNKYQDRLDPLLISHEILLIGVLEDASWSLRRESVRKPFYLVSCLAAVSSCWSSSFCQVGSGLYSFMALARTSVFLPRSFRYTTPSLLTMNVITPDDLYSAG